MTLTAIEQAIADLRAGRMIVVVDDEDRENEGDLVMAAEHVTPAAINFMALHGRGWICLALTPEECDRLELPQMVEQNSESQATAFTITIDAARRFGVTTGISASDRATTIRVAIDPASSPSDLRRPGHIQPLRARPGGVLQRVGHTEASVDLARLAGLRPAGVICEIMNPDGTMADCPTSSASRASTGWRWCRSRISPPTGCAPSAWCTASPMRGCRRVRRLARHRLSQRCRSCRTPGLVYGEAEGQRDVLVRMHSSA